MVKDKNSSVGTKILISFDNEVFNFDNEVFN